jgi:hypothetical protein
MKNLTALLVLAACALSAQAQPAQPAANGVQMSTDPARAAEVERKARELKARAATQPQVFVRGQTESGAAFVSGGNTLEDRVRMHAERERYSLWIATVAKPSGAYLADARLRIVRVGDKSTALERKMEGPWLLVALPPGKYDVSSTFKAMGSDKDQTLSQRVEISKAGLRQVVLRFDSPAEVSPEMNSPFKGNPFGVPSSRP